MPLLLSVRVTMDELVGERGLLMDKARTLGGDAESGVWDGLGLEEPCCEATDTGRDRRYQPPVYVKAMSWYSV